MTKFKPHIGSLLKWLYPGIKIKRWLFLLIGGIILITSGWTGYIMALVSGSTPIQSRILLQTAHAITFLFGIWAVAHAIKKIFRSIISLFLPQQEGSFIDIVYQKRQLARGPKIVAIGGGTGLSTILQGLKTHTVHISAIVTVADDGGSSGRLRQQFDILPPGDIRNCLVALADTEPLMRKLFQFRFGGNSEFSGHSFGNLFITAMTQLTGDFEQAIKESSKVLAIRGNVIPSTLSKVTLSALHNDGMTTTGEAQIPKAGKPINRISLVPEHNAATPEAIRAIQDADIIVMGPGSLFTSIIPNLLIEEITSAIAHSRAAKFYICNIMTQYGETDGFAASDHLKALIKHSNPHSIDYCIINNGTLPQSILDKYRAEHASYVAADSEAIRALGYKVRADNFVTISDVVRHDAGKLASTIIKIASAKRYSKLR